MSKRIILFVFAGREANMELQWPYVERLLETYSGMEYHVWDLTRNMDDHKYLRELEARHERVKLFTHLWPGDNNQTRCRKRQVRPRWCDCVECRPAPFEKVYEWYADGGLNTEDGNAIFVKLDDDIVFIETERFGEILDALEAKPNAVISANVVNNVVSAKHDPDLRPIMERQFRPQTDKAWFDLHADHHFARVSHNWLMNQHVDLLDPLRDRNVLGRCRPGEKLSINFIAMTYPTLCRVSETVQKHHSKLGDEGAINHNFLPWITISFRVAHLYFGPQRVHMDDVIDHYRRFYGVMAEEYLKLTEPA